jgi:hypothetical protein
MHGGGLTIRTDQAYLEESLTLRKPGVGIVKGWGHCERVWFA